ncbi:MAG: SufD family Fe-S cluster assembly protein [Gemmatimonadetes bacterium]|nr:SufD family Fe-S cluster assembly protein [Gemmatimonadota bacterium]
MCRSPSPSARRCRATTSTRCWPAKGAAQRSTGCTCSTATRCATTRRASSTRSPTATRARCTRGSSTGPRTASSTARCTCAPIAQKTDGKQTNKTLLLSDKARIDTKPQLEIFADDVKCTHGATVGKLDQIATFYMKSRGVNADTTRRLLTYAFAAEVLETIELEPLKEDLEKLTLQRYL